MLAKTIKCLLIITLLLINKGAFSQSTILSFKHYDSLISFYESDLDKWYSVYSGENKILIKESDLAYKEYTFFKSRIAEGNKRQKYFWVDNLRYFRQTDLFDNDYYFKEGSDNYKLMLSTVKDKSAFKKLNKIREIILSGIVDLVIANGKKILSN